VERLAQVRDPQEFTKLQMDFVQDQMQGMTEQAKELGEAATKAMLDSAKPATKGGLSS
jgi:phasin family protein